MWHPPTSRNQPLTHGGAASSLSTPGGGTEGFGVALKRAGGGWSPRVRLSGRVGSGLCPPTARTEMGLRRGTQSTWSGGHGAPSLLLVDNRGSGCPETLSLAGSHISIINPTPLCTGDAAFNFLSPSPRRANERKRF